MKNPDEQFSDDLQREDDVGLVLRGHLHIEHQLVDMLSEFLPFADRADWGMVSYRAKVELAYAAGLPEDLKKLLEKIGTLRNTFAHTLSSSITKQVALNLYNSLSEFYRQGLKESYKAMGIGELTSPSSLEPRDLVTLVFINARQAIKAAVFVLREAKA